MSYSSNDIAQIIRDLDLNKAQSHDVISICMLKMCGESVSKKDSLLLNGNKNVVPDHKRGNK